MAYYIDAASVSLDDLQRRIQETDLVPSRAVLLDKIEDQFTRLKASGILTLADLRQAIKNAKDIPALAKDTGIDSNYLTLLRREIQGYFPKAFPLTDFDWLPQASIQQLQALGYKNTAILYEAFSTSDPKLYTLDLEQSFMNAIRALVDLTRIQWISPLAARMLVSAGYDKTHKVSQEDPEVLCQALDRVNQAQGFFKGKIGLRDVKRLIKAASYLTKETDIETKMCTLAPVTPNDYEAIWSLYRDPQVRRYLGGVIDQDTYQSRFEKMCQADQKSAYWCIRAKEDSAFIGLISLEPYHNTKEIEVSYQLSPAWFDRGIGTEVVGAVITYAFSELGLESLVAETQLANIPSCKLLERVGMTLDQTLERFGAMQAVYRICK